jgi:hypothetical protein
MIYVWLIDPVHRCSSVVCSQFGQSDILVLQKEVALPEIEPGAQIAIALTLSESAVGQTFGLRLFFQRPSGDLQA